MPNLMRNWNFLISRTHESRSGFVRQSVGPSAHSSVGSFIRWLVNKWSLFCHAWVVQKPGWFWPWWDPKLNLVSSVYSSIYLSIYVTHLASKPIHSPETQSKHLLARSGLFLLCFHPTSYLFHLSDKPSPHIFDDNLTAFNGQSVTISCSIHARLRPKVSFFWDDKFLKKNHHVEEVRSQQWLGRNRLSFLVACTRR